MTEEEAKTKWCPFERVAERAWDSSVATSESASCRGSACMAWRETKAAIKGKPDGHVMNLTEVVNGVPAVTYIVDETKDALAEGYCGLAGKP